jgi:hypothetical protein
MQPFPFHHAMNFIIITNIDDRISLYVFVHTLTNLTSLEVNNHVNL